MTADAVRCPYCGGAASFHRTSGFVYGGRDRGPVWRCAGCDARVGCHPDGRPLGPLADPELRAARTRAHGAFDPLWRAKAAREGIPASKARGAGYKWLAAQLGIEARHCHIGAFDADACERVVEICAPYAGARDRAERGPDGTAPIDPDAASPTP